MEALRYLVFPLQLILDLQKVDPVIHNKMEINQDYLYITDDRHLPALEWILDLRQLQT